MLIIGLTGGIGSGKSTVSKYLKEKNIPISDADQKAHEIMEPGMPALRELVEYFGEEILDEKGRLKRKYLASIAFTNKENEAKLNEITHKHIKNEIEKDMKNFKADGEPLAILDAPLIFEANLDKRCDATWVVTADEEVRIKRVMARDGISEADVRSRIACQMSDSEKVARADEVLDNSGSVEKLYQHIEELLKKYEIEK